MKKFILILIAGSIFTLTYICLPSALSQNAPGLAQLPTGEIPKDIIELQPTEALSKETKSGFSKKISLDLRDINILDVLKFLAEKGNLNIVTSKNVTGRVTLFLNSVSIQDALEIIVVSNGLAYEDKKGIIYVLTEMEYEEVYGVRFSDNRKVEISKLKYANPTYAFSVLDSIRSSIGKVIIDEGTGVVVMIDTLEKIEEMTKAIREMDRAKMDTRVYSLQYAKPEEVVVKLKPKLDGKKVGTITGDRRSNQVIVSAFPDRMQEMERLIKSLDKKTKEVLIEIRILKIVLNPQFDMGIDWSKAFTDSKKSDLRKLDFRGAFPISSTISSSTALGTIGKIAYGTVGSDIFALELKALKEVSDSKILANPRLTVVSGEEAKIHIGDKLAYVTTATTTGSATSTTAETVSFVDIGIQLNVTPTINDEGFITMKIKPEISSKTGDYETPTGNLIPLINTTLAETNVMVKDSTTIIIGGLRKDEKTHVQKGFPFLMDIPFLGRLFSSVTDEITKTEIVIFLTPHIVGGDLNVTDEREQIKDERKEY